MLDRGEVLAVLKKGMGFDDPDIEIIPLKGDASNRFYYRLKFGKENKPSSMILMQLAEPEAFKKSEEAVSSRAVVVDELPFINILRHLGRSNVAIPKCHFYDSGRGFLFLEDLGDVTLEAETKTGGQEAARRFYYQAIDELLKIQGAVTRDRTPDCIAFGRTFDAPLLMWEFDHFLEYGIEARKSLKIKPTDRKKIQREFLKICNTLLVGPRFFVHRDYHSRNLMVHQDRIWMLDFQDALMGPSVYDLVSLLRDSYVVLPDSTVDELIHYYLQKRLRRVGSDVEIQNPSTFRRFFDFMSLQRNLKAAGRFVYIHVEKGKNHLLPYIPQTLAYVRMNLDRYTELLPLKKALQPYMDELN